MPLLVPVSVIRELLVERQYLCYTEVLRHSVAQSFHAGLSEITIEDQAER